MDTFYDKRNMLNELDLGMLNINNLTVDYHWFHMVKYDSPYNRKFHSHTSCEMHFMINGYNRIFFPDQSMLIGPGEGTFIPAKTMHRISSYGDNIFSKYDMCIGFSSANDSSLNNMIMNTYHSTEPCIIKVDDADMGILDLCLKESIERKTGFLERIQINLYDFLILLARKNFPEQSASFPVTTRKLINDERLQIIESFITEHMSDGISASDIADYMALSTKQINRIIKSGEEYANATEMIAKMKITEAKRLLANPNYLASDIADMLGFSNEYYFNKFFKKIEGLPPGRYRETICAKGPTHDRE